MSVSTQDLNAPFDTTAYTQISGAQLLQLITGASPADERGIFIFTEDVAGVPTVPDAATVTKYQRCAWIRLSATAVSVYVWNPYSPNSDPTLLYWNSLSTASIGLGSITTAMLANNSVTDEKIVSMDASKLTGSLPANILATLVSLASAATGDLTGSTWANPIIAPGVISTSKLAVGSVTANILATDAVETAKIKDANVTAAKIEAGAVITSKIADVNVTLPKLKADIINDATTITPATGDLVLLGDASDSNNTKKATLLAAVTAVETARRYDSGNIALTTSSVRLDTVHSLGAKPTIVRCVLVNISTEGGYAVGDEIDANCVYTSGEYSAFAFGANANNVYIIQADDPVLVIAKKSATVGSKFPIDNTKWNVRLYAQL